MPDAYSSTYPSPSAARLRREADREAREIERDRYLGKFEGLWSDIELAIIGLEVLAEYDSAAREAVNILKDALSDARGTVEASA